MKPDRPITVWIQDRPGRYLTLEWNDPKSGKRRQKSSKTDDYKAAEEQRKALEYELNQGTFKETSRITWKDFRAKVRSEYSVHIRPRAAAKIETVLDAFDKFAPVAKLADVDGSAVSSFAAKLRTETTRRGELFAPWTIKNYLIALRTVLRWAETLELTTCPVFPSIKVPKRLPKPVTDDAFDDLLAAMPSVQWKALLLCAWWAGLRLGEAMALCRRPHGDAPYVDWQADRIVLPPPSNKSGDDQAVPLAKTLRGILEALPGDGEKLIDLRNHRTGKPLTVAGASKNISQWADAAGVKLSMHPARKGFASRVAERAPPAVLQRLMRHADPKTSMAFYANVDDAAADAIKDLDSRGARRGADDGRKKAG